MRSNRRPHAWMRLAKPATWRNVRFEITQKEQTLGAGSTYQTMTAQRDLALSELDLVTAMTVYEKAKVELDRATRKHFGT